jgi:hypothetical protein
MLINTWGSQTRPSKRLLIPNKIFELIQNFLGIDFTGSHGELEGRL